MNLKHVETLFTLLRSVIKDQPLTEQERNAYSPDMLPDLLRLASMHDLAHLLSIAITKNGLPQNEAIDIEAHVLKAVYRYEQLKYAYDKLCPALEDAKIPFIPLKGSVIRSYYPEPWMRTSCDVDVLVHKEDLEKAIAVLVNTLGYEEKKKGSHDVSLFSPNHVHVELHFDLVEDSIVTNVADVLKNVWEHSAVLENHAYWHAMSKEMFYFYHVAHMAKHFERGGCGIKPFIDLWLLESKINYDVTTRDALLEQGGLLTFANASRELSATWLDQTKASDVAKQMQAFVLYGGVYGTIDNLVAAQQHKRGGKFRYFLSRVILPYSLIKKYYPVLEKHPWLTPLMQVRRWIRLLFTGPSPTSRYELNVNRTMSQERMAATGRLFCELGLHNE